MKYMFPRQFGLQNVFTPQSDGRNGMVNFKSGIFREKEITQMEYQRQLRQPQSKKKCADADADGGVASLKVPKRLRGMIETVRKLRNRNARCSYSQLLRYYCPTEVRHSVRFAWLVCR